MLIFKQLPLIIEDIDAIHKTKRDNTSIKYAYRSIDEFMNVLNPLLGKHKVTIIPEVLKNERTQFQSANGAKMLSVVMEIKYTFYAEDGSHVSCTMIGEAFDSGDKASNKAQSVALKYAVMQVFMVPTEDIQDPDHNDTSETFTKQKYQPKESVKSTEKYIEKKGKDIGNYIIKVGKFKDRRLADVDQLQIQDYITWLGNQARANNKPLSGDWLEFAKIAESWLTPSVDTNEPLT